jgi:hypothetical protein
MEARIFALQMINGLTAADDDQALDLLLLL